MLAPMALDAKYTDLVPFTFPTLGLSRSKTGLTASIVVHGVIAIAALICIVILCGLGMSSRRKYSATQLRCRHTPNRTMRIKTYSRAYLPNSIGHYGMTGESQLGGGLFGSVFTPNNEQKEGNTDPYHIDNDSNWRSSNSAFIVLGYSCVFADSVCH